MLQFKQGSEKMKLDEKLFTYFKKAGTQVTYHPKELIYLQEDQSHELFLILKGRVRVYTLTSQGDDITIDVLDKGRIFGDSSFIQCSSRPTTVEAINEVQLIKCKLNQFYPYLHESQELTISLLQIMTDTCNYLTNAIKRAYSYNRYEKVAAFLLELTQKDNIEKGILNSTIPYTHEDIANSVGLARVTVSKILKEFDQKGYIKNSYRKIKVVNKKALVNLIEDR